MDEDKQAKAESQEDEGAVGGVSFGFGKLL